MRFSHAIAPVLVIAAMSMTACDNTQVLYTYEDEPGPRMDPPAAGGAMPPSVTAMLEEEEAAAGQATAAASPSHSSHGEPPASRQTLPADAELTTVSWFGIATEVPSEWREEAPESSMRAAQFTVPAPTEGGRPAELVVFYFGAAGGGGAEANVARWEGQVEADAPAVHYHSHVGELHITEVIVEGTMLPSTMGTGPTVAEPDSALHGVVIEGGPRGSVFLRLSGGREAVRSAEPAMATLIANARVLQ